MPRKSKVSVPAPKVSTKPGEPIPPKEGPDKFYCARCGKSFKRQYNNFSPSHSPLYYGNGGYLPACATCLDDLFAHYKSVLGDGEQAMRRICMKYDIYWNPDIYAMIKKTNSTASRVRQYISRSNLLKYVDKTFDDTLDEERDVESENPPAQTPEIISPPEMDSDDVFEEEVPEDLIAFWGEGFEPSYYRDVQRRYDKWTANLPDDLPVNVESLYQQICMTEENIKRDTIAGKDTDKAKNTLITLMGALNEKPVQKKQDEALDQSFEEAPFGVGIRMCENLRPIPKPDPRFEDVDGVVRYVTVWFLGHLCKMIGIKNTYCKLYEEEMARLRVERSEYEEEEDDEVLFNNIFGDESS